MIMLLVQQGFWSWLPNYHLNQVTLSAPIIFMAYNAEEEGLLGSKYFVENPTIDLSKVTVMINMDMIGRMSDNKVTIGGTGTSPSFKSILDEIESNYDIILRRSCRRIWPE